jgi:MFS family permease
MRDAFLRWGFVAALTLARIAFGYQFQSLASMGPELMAQFQLAYATLGTLIGLYMAPGIFVALPGGMLGRRFGERVVVGIGLGLMTAGALVAAAAAGPAGIGLGRVLAGSGAVTLIVMQGQMVSERFAGRLFMPVMSLLVGAFPVGAGLAGLTHDPVVRAFGWPGMFAIGAAIAGVSTILFLLTCGPGGKLAGGARWAFPSRHESVLVIVSGLIWTAYNSGYYGFLSYVPSLLATRGHGQALTAAVMLIATWFNLPATIVGGILAARFGNWPVFLAGTVSGVVAVAGPALTDWPLVWGTLFGVAGSMQAGVIIAVGTLSARPENRAVGMGLFYTTYYLGGTVLPALCGRAADLVGDPGGALVAAALIACLGVPIYLLHQRLQRRWA